METLEPEEWKMQRNGVGFSQTMGHLEKVNTVERREWDGWPSAQGQGKKMEGEDVRCTCGRHGGVKDCGSDHRSGRQYGPGGFSSRVVFPPAGMATLRPD